MKRVKIYSVRSQASKLSIFSKSYSVFTGSKVPSKGLLIPNKANIPVDFVIKFLGWV